MGMIKNIATKTPATIRCGYLATVLTLEEVSLPTVTEFSVYFRTDDEAEAFAATLPKYVKARKSQLGYHKYIPGEYGLAWIQHPHGSYAPLVSVSTSGINETTGAVNEAGARRLNAFRAAVSRHLEIIANLNEGA